jgi:Na+-driven multidrug efflux pump
MLIFPNTIASLFLQDGDLLTESYIVRYITLCFPFVVFAIVTNCYHNFFRGVMKPMISTTTTTVYTVLRIIFTIILLPTLEMDGVYLGYILSWIIEFILCLIIHISKKWKTPKYKEMEKALRLANNV